MRPWLALLLLSACGESKPSHEVDASSDIRDADRDEVDSAIPDDSLADTHAPSDSGPSDDSSGDGEDLHDGIEELPDSQSPHEDSQGPDETEPALDPQADEDGDGILNGQELLDGTNPHDPRSVKAIQPYLEGHPRVFIRPSDHSRLRAQSEQSTGPAAILWQRLTQFAAREAPEHPLEGGYQTGIPPQQARIAEAAAMVGWVQEDAALVEKALTLLAAPYPDPSPLNLQSQYNSGDHYNLLEAEALASYCTAYDLAAGSPLADEDLRAQAEARLSARLDDFLRLCTQEGGCTRLLRNEKTNHTLKALAALGVCGLALPNHPKSVELFHEAFASTYVIAHQFQGNVEGGWAEGSNYLNYSGDTHLAWFAALHHLASHREDPHALWAIRGGNWLTLAQSIAHTAQLIPAPHQDPLWIQVYQAALHAALPNGLLVPADDSNPSALHGGILATLFQEPTYLWNWSLPTIGHASGRLSALSFVLYDAEMAPSPP